MPIANFISAFNRQTSFLYQPFCWIVCERKIHNTGVTTFLYQQKFSSIRAHQFHSVLIPAVGWRTKKIIISQIQHSISILHEHEMNTDESTAATRMLHTRNFYGFFHSFFCFTFTFIVWFLFLFFCKSNLGWSLLQFSERNGQNGRVSGQNWYVYRVH